LDPTDSEKAGTAFSSTAFCSATNARLGRSSQLVDCRTIFAVALLVVAAKGFTSYFYLDQRGLSVRPPFELALRRYDWANVVAVTIRCQPTAKRRPRLDYVLEMSDGYEIELTLAPKHRFAASLPVVFSLLRSSPNVQYRFEVSEASLAALAKRHGVALANSIREQVSIHGGTLQR
jgi:hypothetical protein